MPVCRFSVSTVAIEPNVRGQQMRRIELRPLPSEAFQHEDPPPGGMAVAEPDANIRMLCNRAFAKRFALGDEFDVRFSEVE